MLEHDIQISLIDYDTLLQPGSLTDVPALLIGTTCNMTT